MDNIREFKVALEQKGTEGVSNFTEALKLAFDVLEKVRQFCHSTLSSSKPTFLHSS